MSQIPIRFEGVRRRFFNHTHLFSFPPVPQIFILRFLRVSGFVFAFAFVFP